MLTVIKINGKCLNLGDPDLGDSSEISAGDILSNPTTLRFYINNDSKSEISLKDSDGYELKIPDPHYEYDGGDDHFDIKIVSVDPPTWMMTSEGKLMTSKRYLRKIISNEILAVIDEIAGKTVKDNTYTMGDKKSLMLDRPTQHGGWPEGEYDPPINQRIYDYLKSLGLVETDQRDKNHNVIRDFIREIISV